jgi:hypothetical protein
VEWTPESAWFPGTKNSHNEDAIAVLVLEGADRPAASRNAELNARIGARFDPELLNWPLQESTGVPERHEDGVFSRAPVYPSGNDEERV